MKRQLYILLYVGFNIFILGLNECSAQCDALFTFEDTELTIQFIDQSTSESGDPIIAWFWDFDDGTTSTLQNPLHTFPEEDVYDVVLQITTQNGCTSEFGNSMTRFAS